MAERYDFTIEKGAKFYREMNLTTDANAPVSLVGKTLRCQIKESYETETVLHDLTEANGGIDILDDAVGRFALVIGSTDTKVDADYAVYDILKIDTAFPELDNERVLQGQITYLKGSTKHD